MVVSVAHLSPARTVIALPLLFVLLWGGVALAQPASRNARREAAIEQQLETMAPAAVDAFRAATAAMDSGRCAEAVVLFQQVIGQAPRFSPALRRSGGCLVDLGKRDEGLASLESALAIERTVENLVTLASSLFSSTGRGTPAWGDAERALPIALEAFRRNQDENDPSYAILVAHIAFFLNRLDEARAAANDLMTRFPDEVSSHYFAAILAAVEGDWLRAEREIREAGRRGLPPEVVEQFLDSGVRGGARLQRASWWTVGLVAAWAAGLLFLYVAGKGLSRRTLRSLGSPSSEVDVTPRERSLRRTYRRLIAVAGSYYYVSLPFVMAGIVIVSALVIYFFMAIGWLPLVLLWALVIGALVTMFRMVQTLFIKIPADLPGRSLERAEAPGLWGLATQVAQAVGTRPVDEIRITAGTEMAVFEGGTRRERREDRARRVLVMGAGLLAGLRQGPFCAVLAHEYGHFAHRDTAGGDIALRVGQDMHKLAVALVNSGQAVWWNVACHFLRLYDLLFRRIAYGATRLQEVLADRVAARRYGADNFEEGLRHVVRRQIEFGVALQREVQEAVDLRRPIRNIYDPDLTSADIEEALAQALTQPTREDDTHPSPMERFDLVRGLLASGATPDGLVWDLFANRTALAVEMTEGINTQIVSLMTPDPVSAPT